MTRRILGLLVLLALGVVYVPPVVPSWPAERVRPDWLFSVRSAAA